MAKKSKSGVQRTCQECGKKFVGNQLSRYCPECRQEIIREKEALAARPSKIVAREQASKPVKKYQSGLARYVSEYLTFTRAAVINFIIILGIYAVAFYLENSPSTSLAVLAKVEEFKTASYAACTMLVWGFCLRGYYYWRERKGDETWKEHYWKQLLTWLICNIFTVGFAVYTLAKSVPDVG